MNAPLPSRPLPTEPIGWQDHCRRLLDRAARRLRIETLALPYERGFSEEYRALIPPRSALRDILRLEAVRRGKRDVADLIPPLAGLDAVHDRVQVYSAGERGLDEIMPVLRNLNLRVIDQIQFKVAVGERQFYIRSFSVQPAIGGTGRLLARKGPLREALDALLSGRVEDDALNGLILSTGLHWQDIDLLRAYRNYYDQLAMRYGGFRFDRALLGNPSVVRLLYRYFRGRFDPDGPCADPDSREEEILSPIRLELIAALNEVADAADDRILRDLFNLIDATLRTNFYRRRDGAGDCIALKISSLGVINMPSPAPLVEIYVHARNMEGIHLRGARVARGGIRWSDRPEDFRSEILGLMRTQMVKNALIVPQGAKGGFVLKTACRSLDECNLLGQAAYVTLMRGLLDLTDNVEEGHVVRPPGVVAYDDDDPYLVVAADKGTARWSDTANAVAAEYGFWLGDAYASGGSHGYHHKRLGITARGAWVCVRRHFHELGHDIETQPLTVVGVGSMDGDVFGNGMLRSRTIRLLGAFSARHIFLDPDPDPERSYAERQRLFELPGSTWQDYDPALISAGGGVYRRAAKEIPLSPEVRAWLGVRQRATDGEGLVRLLLTAPVDLLWLGGIGTYVKASAESNEDVGDRANDSVRVDALQLRAKVVGEGANLGFTQPARIEYALEGGRIHTDAVDNSGGVDLSDHEVNLKVLLELLRQRGVMTDEEARNRLLAELTDEVCASVLANNYQQALCLALERERSLRDPEPLLQAADLLENAGLLDRRAESFPSRREIHARPKPGLTQPELAVLMAHAKLALKRVLLDAPEFLAGEWAHEMLADYFPQAVRSRYGMHLPDHSLAREIAATVVCNRAVNQAGAGLLAWSDELDPPALLAAVGAYLTGDRLLEGQGIRERIHALDGVAPTGLQYQLLLQLEDALAFFSRWAVDHGQRLTPGPAQVLPWRATLGQYLEYLQQSLGEAERTLYEQRLAELTSLGFTPEQGRRLAFLDRLRDFPLLVDTTRRCGQTLQQVAVLTGRIMDLLDGTTLLQLLAEVKVRDPWERRLQSALDHRMRAAVAHLCRLLLAAQEPEPALYLHRPPTQRRLEKLLRLRREFDEAPQPTLTPFAALACALEALVDACEAACAGAMAS